MKNFRIIQTRPEIKNGWVVKADSIRFGDDAIVFEGNYGECWEYVQTITDYYGRERVRAKVFGERNGVEMQGVTIVRYNDGFEHYPQYEFPNFILPTDIERLYTFLA